VLRNILYISGGIFVFFVGMVIYGIILNSGEINLAEAMQSKGLSKLENVHLVVNKNKYRVELYSNTLLIKSYKAVFGKNKSEIKTFAEDYVTPLGSYIICSVDTNSVYHKFLKLNYPNLRDAAEALKNGYISNEEYMKLKEGFNNNDCSPYDTKLGANIGIHGIGEYNLIFKNLPFVFNWTNGSIAVSNESIDEIYEVTHIGTKVEIRN
jgi:murein L,D-transpeptidase YafK